MCNSGNLCIDFVVSTGRCERFVMIFHGNFSLSFHGSFLLSILRKTARFLSSNQWISWFPMKIPRNFCRVWIELFADHEFALHEILIFPPLFPKEKRLEPIDFNIYFFSSFLYLLSNLISCRPSFSYIGVSVRKILWEYSGALFIHDVWISFCLISGL